MDKLSDIVRDSELDTRVTANYTEHVYFEPDPDARRRAVRREERWQRQSCIGGGSYGRIWLEKCVNGRRGVEVRAVKEILVRQRNAKPVDYSRELEAIAKFSHRKYERCFVKSFGWFENAGCLFIPMEYLELGDLEKYLSSVQPLFEQHARDITFQIVEGLQFMHKNQFAHRDLKPANILVKSRPPDEWWVKIGDFGISKRIEDELAPLSRTLKGTEGFIAPELYRLVPRGTDYATDMWALGEIAFRMLMKVSVFEDLRHLCDFAQGSGSFPSSRLHSRGIGDSAVTFISSSMELLPEKRLTAEDAMSHDWMKQIFPETSPPPLPITDNRISSNIESPAEEFVSWNTTSASHNTQPTIEPFSNTINEDLGNTNTKEGILDTRIIDRLIDYFIGEFKRRCERDFSFSTRAIRLLRTACEHAVQDLHSSGQASIEIDALTSGIDFYTTLSRARFNEVCKDLLSPAANSRDHAIRARGKHRSESYNETPRAFIGNQTETKDGTQVQSTKFHELPCIKGSGSTYRVVVSPNGKMIASCDHHIVRIWDADTGVKLRELIPCPTLSAVIFSPDSKLIAISGDDNNSTGALTLWDVTTGRLPLQRFCYNTTVRCAAFSPDVRMILSADMLSHNGARLWNIETGCLQLELDDHQGFVNSIAFSPDGKLIALGGVDGKILLWDAATGNILMQLKGSLDSIRYVAFSPDGTSILFNSRHGVMLWGFTTDRELVRQIGFGKYFFSTVFSPDGKMIISSTGAGLKLWNLVTGHELDPHKYGFSEAAGEVWGLAAYLDGLVAAGGKDRIIRRWRSS